MSEFQQIVKDYKDQVFNTCLGMIKNFEDAEDLSQEVFIEVYLNLSKFIGSSSIKTWLYRIAVNKCLEYIRKQKAQKRSSQNVPLDERAVELSGFDHPGVKLENRELAKVLFAAVDKLSENQRVAFTLHKVENLSHEEISAVMQKSISSVESLIHRAKQNLKENLKMYYEGT